MLTNVESFLNAPEVRFGRVAHVVMVGFTTKVVESPPTSSQHEKVASKIAVNLQQFIFVQNLCTTCLPLRGV